MSAARIVQLVTDQNKTEMKIDIITLVNAEWNYVNGFIFNVLYISTPKWGRSLFAVYFSKEHIYIELLFFSFTLMEKRWN